MESIQQVRRWERIEVEVAHPSPPGDPFRDVSLDVELTNPYGDTVCIDGFHDGGARWAFRFAPDGPGEWSYLARFSDGAAERSGTFRCGHGDGVPPVAVNPANPVWFRRGVEPFLMRALHVGDRFFAANWPARTRRAFLDWCQDQGYNTLSIGSFLLNRNEKGRGAGWESPRLWPLDPSEFAKAEVILDDLAARGIAVFPFGGFFGRQSHCPRDPADQERFLRYVLARWGCYPNLLYNVSGPEPSLESKLWLPREEVERLGRLIRKLDVYGRPLSVHNPTGDDPYRDSDWSTFGTLQGPKTVDRRELQEGLLRNLHPSKPLLAQETLWSGNRFHVQQIGRDYTDDDIRRNALTLALCGVQLCFADNQGTSSSGFSGSMDLHERVQHRHDIVRAVWDWLETTPYHEMRPSPELAGGRPCLAWPGRRYLVFLEGGGEVNVDTAGEPMAARWVSAVDFRECRDAGYTSDGQGLSAPDDRDWVLDLRRNGCGLADQVHLSSEGEPSRSVTVAWHTASGREPAQVRFREAGSDTGWQRCPAASADSPGAGRIHTARLAGLSPDTEYLCEVSHDAPEPGGYSKPFSFRTAPEDLAKPVRFAFLCDTGLTGRLDGNVDGAASVLEHLLADQPRFVLGGGDWAYANRDRRFRCVADAIDEWFCQWQPLLCQVPFYTQFGNHEAVLEERYEDWAPRLAQPEGSGDGRSFSFDVAGIHIAAPFVPNERGFAEEAARTDSPLLSWLDRDLADARRRGADWLIVFQHLPLFGHGTSHPAHPAVRKALAPILERHRVDLHLSGHDQNFERTFPLSRADGEPKVEQPGPGPYRHGAGVVYAKVSPAGKRSEIGNQFSRLPRKLPAWIAVADDTAHHYALVDVTRSSLIVNTYAIARDGEPRHVADRFEIRKSN